MSDPFVHLHSHTCYSLLDGLARIDDLLESATQQQMPALALTDHGTMFGAIEFYSKAKAKGIKPIIGCEVYVSDRPLEERPGPGAQNYHLVLLAETEAGYRNLIKLTTEAHLRGFYRKPRVDHALLEQHAEGLVCLSGCASGELASKLIKGDRTGAGELADWYGQVFPERYYLELQYHNLEFQKSLNEGLLDLQKKSGLPMVASNDVHYVYERHAYTHEVLLCIQTQTTMDDPKRMRMEQPEFYLKTVDQMRTLFGHVPGAIENTLAIAERCNLELTFGRPQLPRYECPDGRTSEQHLRILCQEGLLRRYPSPSADARARLDYELSIINQTGFIDYFLLVYDVIHFARNRGIAVGPGRGSAAGSLVAYSLYLTNVDPMSNGLSFERFLNPERVSMPDMDLDFADDRRDEVIRYVSEKFGRDRVAQIITFGTIGPRAGLRDVGRVLGMPYSDLDRVAKLVPLMCSKLAKAKEDVPELQQLYDSDPSMRKLMDTVEDLEGVARHASTHAAGIVIARDPLNEHVPLYKVPKNDQIITQYAMDSIEKIGLLKMDLLGLRTLTILDRACALIRQSHGIDLVPDDIPLDDPCIYELLGSGETFGVFQVDGAGMRKAIQQVRPTEFGHLVAVLALYRPGPMDYIPEFGARKNGESKVTYEHPALEEVLKETYGIVVYQEQVMQLAVHVAGYSAGEGDLLRRAMGKKKPEELAKHRKQFVERAGDRGTSREVAEKLFNIIEPFAGYAFNKSHSAAYALITCQTAYLKARYPREYMAGLMSAERENSERVADALAECRRLDIAILQPDVNGSDLDFTLEENSIRFGLTAIKHAGEGSIEALLRERRENGPFESLEDFCGRVDWGVVNKRLVECLAKCGALDSLGVERARVMEGLDKIVSFGTALRRNSLAGQVSLFGGSEEPAAVLQLPVATPSSLEDRIAWEEELLGTAISRHPVVDAADRFRDANAVPLCDVSPDHHNTQVSLGGLMRASHTFSTRDGRPMAKFQLTDLRVTIEAVAFTRTYEKVQAKLLDGTLVVVDGRLDAQDGRPQLIVDAVYTLDEAPDRPKQSANGRRNGNGNGNGHSNGNGNGHSNGSGNAALSSLAVVPSGPARRISIEIVRGADREADLERVLKIYSALRRSPGHDEVEILVRQGVQLSSVPLPDRCTGYTEALERELRDLVGDGLRVSSVETAA